MELVRRSTLALLAVGAIALVGCRSIEETTPVSEPARVEPIAGSDLNRVVLTSRAAERLGIEMVPVQSSSGKQATSRVAIPYGSIVYFPDGGAWAYTNPEPLVFVRHAIVVDEIRGNVAYLRDGPTPGTEVVSVGAALLLGVEFGIGK